MHSQCVCGLGGWVSKIDYLKKKKKKLAFTMIMRQTKLLKMQLFKIKELGLGRISIYLTNTNITPFDYYLK